MAGAIVLPRLIDSTPDEQPGKAPTTGASVPHPGTYETPDYSGIISAIRSGYAHLASVSDDTATRVKLARESNQLLREGADIERDRNDILRDTARNNAIIGGVQLASDAFRAYGQAQRIAQE